MSNDRRSTASSYFFKLQGFKPFVEDMDVHGSCREATQEEGKMQIVSTVFVVLWKSILLDSIRQIEHHLPSLIRSNGSRNCDSSTAQPRRNWNLISNIIYLLQIQ